ncbi:BLUF domain-containing protein [Marivita sp.]|uniref:BLUF domain-containing protein n=1 Tax=Marivita sp. TaxID=2003365 RepID=UPI00261D6C77|nr:BLUF domain-containing protein [Marivita sp.]
MQTEDTLHQIVYFSQPTRSMPLSEVRELLIKAQINNHFNDVTGLLLFDGDSFVQVLEGPKDKVMALYEKIERDPRHTRFTTLMEREIPQRDFGQWSMGLAHIEGKHMKSLPGLTDIESARRMLSDSGAAESLVEVIKSHYGDSDNEQDVA